MGEHHSLVNVNYRCHFVGKHSFRCNWQQQCCRNQRKTSASKAVSLGSGRRYCSSCTSKSLSLHCLISEKRNFNTKKKQKKNISRVYCVYFALKRPLRASQHGRKSFTITAMGLTKDLWFREVLLRSQCEIFKRRDLSQSRERINYA